MTQYKKYVKIYLPRLVFDYLHYKLTNNPPSIPKLDVDIFYSILSDLSDIRFANSYEDDNEFIPMASTYLKVKYGNSYASYTHYLINNSIVCRTPYFNDKCDYYKLVDVDTYIDFLINNYYTVSYCFPEDFKFSLKTPDNTGANSISKSVNKLDCVEIKIDTKSRVGKYIINAYNKQQDKNKHAKSHIKKMCQFYMDTIQIDADKAVEHTCKKYSVDMKIDEAKAWNAYTQRMQSIYRLTDGKSKRTLLFHRNPTNKRIDTNLTGLASDLRQFIIGYENLTYLDLSNSQPVLLNLLLKKHQRKANSKMLKEMALYEDLTVGGEWYAYLAKLYKVSKDDAKKKWMQLAYSKNRSYSGIKKIFSRAFPEISKFIMSQKIEQHNKFAIALQKIESEIFIDEICKELIENEIDIYCIHDGVMIPKIHQQKGYEIMIDVLKNHLKRVPVISIDGVKKYSDY
jgi:hypothetical protein